MSNLASGFVQIYTGNGKGKTSAALGVALRAAGAGLKTLIIQFMKVYPYSEQTSIKLLSDYIAVRQFGGDKFVYEKRLPSDSEKKEIAEGLLVAGEALNTGEFDIIILDEIFVAEYFKAISESDIINLINSRKPEQELILTGRYASAKVMELADLVTEMKEVKHYYTSGVLSRKGIDS